MSKFSEREISKVVSALSTIPVAIRTNKCGNIDLKHSKSDDVHFVIYKRRKFIFFNKYFIRKRFGRGSGFNQHGGILNRGNYFSSLSGLLDYFTNYAEKNERSLYSVRGRK